MVIVDSSVWIDAFNGKLTLHTIWLRHALEREPVGITSLILCEVLQGIRFDRGFRQTEQRLRILPVFASFTPELAVQAAHNFRMLRRRGVTIRRTIDCIIATFCIEEDYQLLHHDSDFDHFEKYLGLRVIHPPEIPLN